MPRPPQKSPGHNTYSRRFAIVTENQEKQDWESRQAGVTLRSQEAGPVMDLSPLLHRLMKYECDPSPL